MPEVNFGQYDPTDCTDQKIAHGTNCTLICAPGFEAKGTLIKTCHGKKTGVWTNRNKFPKCVGSFIMKLKMIVDFLTDYFQI